MPEELEAKDPEALLPYGIDWSTYLPDGETIVTSEWEAEDGLVPAAHSMTGTTTTVWLEGGTVRTTYEVKNKISTSGDRVEVRRFLVRVRER